MIARTFFLMAGAMAAQTLASPMPAAEEGSFTPVPLPTNTSIDLSSINLEDYKNPANWRFGSFPNSLAQDVNGTSLEKRAGACDQGTCPDYFAAFDLVYSFVAVPVPGDPPLTIFEASSDIRVNDCGQCLRHTVATSLGAFIPGGCYDFKTCGRDQSICVDTGNYRAHRIWKDNGHKTCYNMRVESLGGCGYIKDRTIVRPSGETACNW